MASRFRVTSIHFLRVRVALPPVRSVCRSFSVCLVFSPFAIFYLGILTKLRPYKVLCILSYFSYFEKFLIGALKKNVLSFAGCQIKAFPRRMRL